MSFLLPAFLPVVLLSPTSDWPQFRGPTGAGHASAVHLPTEWTPTKNILWKQTIPGSGWSSPVIVSGKIYLTTSVQEEGNLSLRALCLDASTGVILWNVAVFEPKAGVSPRIHNKNSHASPTPIVEEGKLYVHFGHQGTACLDLTGKVLWRNTELRYAPVHGNGGSPVLVEGLLVFSTDGSDVRRVVALDAATGKVRWKADRTGSPGRAFSFTTPLVLPVGNQTQVISPASDMVGGYDLKTGKEVWRVSYNGYSVIPRPIFGHGLVFVCTGYNTPSLLAIRPEGTGDLTSKNVAWTHKRQVPHTPSLLLIGDELYMVSDNGFASCLDARTGKVHWNRRLGGTGYSASPLFAGGNIYFVSEDGMTTVVKPGTTFEQVARNEMKERTLASLAVADGSLFLRTANHLYRIGTKAPAR